VKVLLDLGANVNATNFYGETPLMCVIDSRTPDIGVFKMSAFSL
jgi:ankyrin repeat protein